MEIAMRKKTGRRKINPKKEKMMSKVRLKKEFANTDTRLFFIGVVLEIAWVRIASFCTVCPLPSCGVHRYNTSLLRLTKNICDKFKKKPLQASERFLNILHFIVLRSLRFSGRNV